jgi:phosphatidate cytidylyltransferase
VLKERVLTAVVLVVVLLGVMLGLPPVATVWLLTILVLIGAWEWAGFLGKGGVGARAGYTALIALGLVGGLYLYASAPGFVPVVMWVAVGWWFIAFLWICLAPGHVNPLTAGLAGVMSLVPCWLALVYLTYSTQTTWWVLFTLALVWAADTGAFFAGRWLGRVPLAPRVSPKKTWEGVIGGVLTSGLVAWLATHWLPVKHVWPFVMTCVAVAALSIVGDLTESMLKRAAGLKDSGNLFPGHGGMLDRIDSVTAAAPALLFALLGLGVVV